MDTNKIDTNKMDTNKIDTNKMDTNKMDTHKMLVNMDTDTDTVTDKQCIICLEKTPINDKDHITLMNEMHFLIKKCDCLCYAHHKCLEKWMSTNAVCPICKRDIAFPIKNTDVVIDIQGNGAQRNDSLYINDNVYNNNNMRSTHFCIRMIILVFFSLTVLQIVLCN